MEKATSYKRISVFFLIAVAMLIFPKASMAQEERDNNSANIGSNLSAHFDESAPQRIMPTRYGGRLRKIKEAEEQLAIQQEADRAKNDSLCLPLVNQYGQPESVCRYPWAFGGWNSWALHKGLNVQLGASVFAQFGKGARSGAGFQQNVALMYATPLTDKLSLAVGGYLNNVNYDGSHYFDAGLSAVLGYRFNDHWEVYVYGQKSITNSFSDHLRYSMYDGYYGGMGNPYMGKYGWLGGGAYGMSYSMYDICGIGDRLGATVRYNVNNSLSIEVSVEKRWMPSRW